MKKFPAENKVERLDPVNGEEEVSKNGFFDKFKTFKDSRPGKIITRTIQVGTKTVQVGSMLVGAFSSAPMDVPQNQNPYTEPQTAIVRTIDEFPGLSNENRDKLLENYIKYDMNQKKILRDQYSKIPGDPGVEDGGKPPQNPSEFSLGTDSQGRPVIGRISGGEVDENGEITPYTLEITVNEPEIQEGTPPGDDDDDPNRDPDGGGSGGGAGGVPDGGFDGGADGSSDLPTGSDYPQTDTDGTTYTYTTTGDGAVIQEITETGQDDVCEEYINDTSEQTDTEEIIEEPITDTEEYETITYEESDEIPTEESDANDLRVDVTKDPHDEEQLEITEDPNGDVGEAFTEENKIVSEEIPLSATDEQTAITLVEENQVPTEQTTDLTSEENFDNNITEDIGEDNIGVDNDLGDDFDSGADNDLGDDFDSDFDSDFDNDFDNDLGGDFDNDLGGFDEVTDDSFDSGSFDDVGSCDSLDIGSDGGLDIGSDGGFDGGSDGGEEL